MPNAAFSAEVTADRAIAVERAMYFNQDGHASAAATSPSRTWYLPEGFTSGEVDTWLLLYNPNPTAARATVTFLRESGNCTTAVICGALRATVSANGLVPAPSRPVTSDQPIVAGADVLRPVRPRPMGSAILPAGTSRRRAPRTTWSAANPQTRW
jgi:hypothetical protein